jgi:membrane protein
MAIRHNIKIFKVLQEALIEFKKNDPLRMAAATAFFATFALPAILIILIQVFGLIVDPDAIGKRLLDGLSDVIGRNTVMELKQTLINVRQLAGTWYVATGGFLFLIFVSTTMFKVIKDSLNQLWNIRIVEHPGIAFRLASRGKSFVAVLLAGLLFLTFLFAEGLVAILGKYINETGNKIFLRGIFKQVISLAVVTFWFTMLFKYLPDGRLSRRVAFAGGLFTGLLFTFGKLIIAYLLSLSNMQTIYGTSASFVLLLLFIFYCSLIFYYGACFTKLWAVHIKQPVLPAKHARIYKISSIDQ